MLFGQKSLLMDTTWTSQWGEKFSLWRRGAGLAARHGLQFFFAAGERQTDAVEEPTEIEQVSVPDFDRSL